MSLLNDMLRDLAQDNARAVSVDSGVEAAGETAGEKNSAHEQHALFSQSSAAKPMPRNIFPSIVVFVVVLMSVLLWRYFLTAVPASPQSETVTAPVQVQPATTDISTQTAITSSPSVAATELGERLAALESAVTSLTEVLSNTEKNNAAQYSSPTTPVTNAAETAVPAEEFLSGDDTFTEASSTETPASVSIKEPFVRSAGDIPNEQPENAVPINDAIAAEAGDPSLFIAPNRAWQDQQFAAKAREAFQAGQVEQTVVRLEDFIASHLPAAESTRLLLDIFCMQENTAAAQQLLTQANYLSPETQTYYAAKIALLNNNVDEAIALLESSLVAAENDENYRALLAGLYQRSGMNLEAASHYRRLLSVFGEKPAYWLGFALAQDALNKSQLALQAYQRVNQYSDLQPQVRAYVEQRLIALGQ